MLSPNEDNLSDTVSTTSKDNIYLKVNFENGKSTARNRKCHPVIKLPVNIQHEHVKNNPPTNPIKPVELTPKKRYNEDSIKAYSEDNKNQDNINGHSIRRNSREIAQLKAPIITSHRSSTEALKENNLRHNIKLAEAPLCDKEFVGKEKSNQYSKEISEIENKILSHLARLKQNNNEVKNQKPIVSTDEICTLHEKDRKQPIKAKDEVSSDELNKSTKDCSNSLLSIDKEITEVLNRIDERCKNFIKTLLEVKVC